MISSFFKIRPLHYKFFVASSHD